MQKTPYVALLRGINVGGNNIIKMADLKAHFIRMNFTDVATYIQSGNVIFTSEETNISKLTTNIEQELSKKFAYTSKIVLLNYQQLEETVENAPPEFGEDPKKYRYDVLFIKPPLTPQEAIKSISIKAGVDEVSCGNYAVYFSRLISKITQSHISRIVQLPIYQNITIRNWNTTTKLLSLMENSFKSSSI